MEEELLALLKEEEKKLQEFVELLKKKRKSIEKNETKKLEDILKEEEKIVKELNSLEKRRFFVTDKMAKERECSPILSEVVIHTQEPLRHDLVMEAARLMELLNEVSLINMGIQEMIAYRLEEFEIFMDAMRGKKITYDGRENDVSGSIFNGRA